jgi:hypothetical protein
MLSYLTCGLVVFWVSVFTFVLGVITEARHKTGEYERGRAAGEKQGKYKMLCEIGASTKLL